MESQDSIDESKGMLVPNLMHFARVLRAAGLPIGPGQVIDAVEAVRVVGITKRDDFYWTLHSVFVNRSDQRELFDQAFHVFWRNPKILERMMSMFLPTIEKPDAEIPQPLKRRIAEALGIGQNQNVQAEQKPQVEFDAILTWSERETLQHKDFEQMSADEIRQAKEAVKAMRLPVKQLPIRRFKPSATGERIDMRTTLRNSLRFGTDFISLVRKQRRERPPPIIILCDISGSMSRYSQMLLHFIHTLTGDRQRVYSFVFGTRLTAITRYVKEKDVDIALDKVSGVVQDWSGGTRIGECLHTFNRIWSRRVLSQGALVLLISDGLDRGDSTTLEHEMERLHKSCRCLIWLNPLLRYKDFEPRSAGIKTILPHVDDFRAVHNLKNLENLTATLSQSIPRREEGVTRWLQQTQS